MRSTPEKTNKTKKSKTVKVSTIGYLKISVDEQAIMNQKLEILEYCRTHQLNIDKWLESNNSSSDNSFDKVKTEELLNLEKNNILISTSISRLGKSSSEILRTIHKILAKGVRMIFTDSELDLNPNDQDKVVAKKVLAIFSVLMALEKDVISLRIKEGFSLKRKQGFSIGKAKGTIQKSIYDSKKEQILFLLSKEISVFDISKIIGIGKPRSLLIYLNKRKLRTKKI